MPESPGSAPSVKTPITYYGGKMRLADWIVSHLPPHRVYLEAFFGSGAVLFAKPRATHEIVNDIDGHVIRFFRLLRERPEDLERVCRLTPYARDERARALDVLADGDVDDLELARCWWVLIQQSYGHKLKGTGWSTSIGQGSNKARTVWNSIERFAPAAERLCGVTIENRDALEVVPAYDAPDAVIYLDPPYLKAVRTGLAGNQRPNGDYVHEFQTGDEHRALADVARACKGTVIVSGYAGELYEDLYDGWSIATADVVRSSANGRRGSSPLPRSTEVLWINRPLETLFTESPRLTLEVPA